MIRRTAIDINFASKNYRLFARVYSGLTAASVFLAVLALFVLGKTFSYRSGIAVMDVKVKEMAQTEEQVRPVLMEREQLTRDLSAMSALMEARKFSWTRFLTDIESVFPVGVALSRVGFNPRDRSLMFDGTALSPEALRNFMVGLEKSPSFRDPFLKHQSVDKGSISFNVAARYREAQAAAVAPVSAGAQGK